MSLQNRVDPFGRLNAVASHAATQMGNRGILHDEEKRVVRPWASRAWICCVLRREGVRRDVFGGRSWSELFFLDEATAFAAGHRPCAYCRRERFVEFRSAWAAANGHPDLSSHADPCGKTVRVAEIDARLHAERVGPSRTKRTFAAHPGSLPTGTMIAINGAAWLLWNGNCHRWSFDGYGPAMRLAAGGAEVDVLTPASIVRMFAAGFTPAVHESLPA